MVSELKLFKISFSGFLSSLQIKYLIIEIIVNSKRQRKIYFLIADFNKTVNIKIINVKRNYLFPSTDARVGVRGWWAGVP